MADVELLPLPRWMETYRIPGDDFHTGPDQYLSERMQSYARANLAPLQAENERLRAEVREAREFRDKMANAIGNDQLRRFIEKHGEPVPLTIRLQEAEARAERLAEALREAEEHINALTPEWYSAGQRLLATIRAALHPTAAQESKESFWPKLPGSGGPDWTGHD